MSVQRASAASSLVETSAWRGLWALVIWSVLLFYATMTHQPPYRTDFAGWARYVTGTEFLFSHLVASIVGAAVGILGFVALTRLLAERGAPRMAITALVAVIVGITLTTAVFGVAAFAQPAIGRAFLAGHTEMPALYEDVNSGPLFGTALPGVLLLSAGLVGYGVALVRTRLAPRLAGWALAIGGPVFAILGVALADIVQSVGAALLVVGTVLIAWSGRSRPRGSPRSQSRLAP